MIKLIKPKFWDRKKFSFTSCLIYPFSLITLIIVFIKKKFSRSRNFKVPIICVGNIYIGGTGKTPTAIFLNEELSNYGIKSAILRKYYKSHLDEHNLIKNKTKNLIINKNRSAGVVEAEKKGFDLVILDDGLQDYNIKKNLKVVCFNSYQLIGNGLVIPAGPLRENFTSLKDSDIVLINGRKDLKFEEKIHKVNKKLEIYYSFYKPININEFKNHKLLALAGIANPENFFKLLEEHKLKIEQKLIFSDHYRFTKEEIQNIIMIANQKKLKIIMTEKDYFKINKFGLREINYLKVDLVIENKEKFLNQIKEIL